MKRITKDQDLHVSQHSSNEMLAAVDYRNHEDVKAKIEKAINEQNHFWWGCVIGEQYGKIVTIRVSEKEEAEGNKFTPIVRIKYGNPYAGQSPKGHIVEWYVQ